MSVLTSAISGVVTPLPAGIVWPRIDRALQWLGGGWWHLRGSVVCTRFEVGGIAVNHFVRQRACRLQRGRLTVTVAAAVAALPALFATWQRAQCGGAVARQLQSGDLAALPAAHRRFVAAKRRPAAPPAALAAPPRCIRAAMTQPQPWKNKMRWMMAHTIVSACRAAGIPHVAMVTAAAAAMRARGDGDARIREFQAAAKRAAQKGSIEVPCRSRHASRGGLWCPLAGDVARCASERGRTVPRVPTPHAMWTAPALH